MFDVAYCICWFVTVPETMRWLVVRHDCILFLDCYPHWNCSFRMDSIQQSAVCVASHQLKTCFPFLASGPIQELDDGNKNINFQVKKMFPNVSNFKCVPSTHPGFRFHHSAAGCVSALAGQWSESERAFKSDQAVLGAMGHGLCRPRRQGCMAWSGVCFYNLFFSQKYIF